MKIRPHQLDKLVKKSPVQIQIITHITTIFKIIKEKVVLDSESKNKKCKFYKRGHLHYLDAEKAESRLEYVKFWNDEKWQKYKQFIHFTDEKMFRFERNFINAQNDRFISNSICKIDKTWLSKGAKKQNYSGFMIFGSISYDRPFYLARYDQVGDGKVSSSNYIEILRSMFQKVEWRKGTDILMYDGAF